MRLPSHGPLLPALVSILTFALAASAILVNHTVDNQAVLNPAVLTYAPQEGLDSWIPGQTCTSCLILPGVIDPSKTYDGTWTYTGQPPTEIVASFTGTAVYVFNVLPNTVPSLTATFSNLSFGLDGVDAGQFVHIPDSTSNILYNVSVFTAVNLANAPHVLTINVQGQNACHVLFDYLVYTADEPDPQTSSTPSTSINSSSMAQSSGILSPSIASPEPRTSSTYQMSTVPSAQPQTSSISPTSDTPSPKLQTSSNPPASITSPPGGSAPISPSPRSSSNTSTPIGTIVGGVIGAIAILLLAGFYATLGRPVWSPSLSPDAESGSSRTSQDRAQTDTTMYSTAADTGATSIGPSIRISLQSDKDAIREQIAELREEFERMTRDRAAERMRNFHEPPPVYEEVQPITWKEDSSSW
ncbi:hypothetical protein GY45DRAFT_1334484 [Cubamyces sp. BRFM 1775]|nr:hypothetical protein GY45DRAFT_1334484 [Cubamyces sp. BRFM 1775]